MLPTMNNTTVNEDAIDEFDYDNIAHRFTAMLNRPQDIIAVIFGVISIGLNITILLALFHVRSRIVSAHYRFIISLAVSDILVGGTVVMFIVNTVVNPPYSSSESIENNAFHTVKMSYRCSSLSLKALNTSGLNITMMNLMLMAMDHYMAIMKPLHYPLIMTRSRVIVMILAAWIIALVLGFSDFFSAIGSIYYKIGYNFCDSVWLTIYQEEFTVFAIAPICLGIMTYMYIRIYIKIRRRRTPGLEERMPRGQPARTTKALITTLLTLGTFILSWLPLCLFEIVFIIKVFSHPEDFDDSEKMTLRVVNNYLFNLLIFNAIADPVIYTMRMHEVRLGFRSMFCRTAPVRRTSSLTWTTRHVNSSSIRVKLNTDMLLTELDDK